MKPPTACHFLCNKHFFFPPAADPADEPDELTTPFWCLKTQDAVGPDGGDVGDRCCGPDRPCFKPEVDVEL